MVEQTKPSRLRLAAAALVLALVGWAIVDALSGAPEAKVAKPPISVSAIHLVGDYNENILAARKRYDGRQVKVGGTLDYLTAAGSDVSLRFRIPGFPNAGVEADFEDGSVAGLEALKPGQYIHLSCDRVEEGPITPKLYGCALAK